ncbi:MAG: TrkH family potassium uptake protein [Dethiobacteria bacterium]
MRKRPKQRRPAQVLALSFMSVILAGSLLLSLPYISRGRPLSYLDALFTATSAVCVTGLTVVDTGTFFTPLGQAIIAALFFVGSLGFMTLATTIFVVFFGRRISLQERLVVKEALNQDTLEGLAPLIRSVLRMAVALELAGAALLSLRFVPEMGWWRGFLFSLFHAVSAFSNAGFDLMGGYRSLTEMPTDYLVNGTLLFLFIVGGLGFPVIFDLLYNRRRLYRLTLHTRLVLVITAILLIFGTLAVLVLEYNNPETMGSLSFGGKLFTAFFTAAAPRTAGFSVLDNAALLLPTRLLILLLMFIGASPASTGGGVKTTTLALVLIAMVALIRGQREPVLLKRRLDLNQVLKATTILVAAMGLIFLSTFILALTENYDFISLFNEAVAAFSSSGMSTGITPELGLLSKAVLIVTMFVGRIGPLTLFIALARPRREEGLHYPEEKLLIG